MAELGIENERFRLSSEGASLVLQNVRFGYDASGDVIWDLSMVLPERSTVGIMGPSGCGKSTLLRLIGGFLEPDSGEILLNGEDLTGVPPQRRPTSLVFQRYSLFPEMTAGENLEFGLKVRGVRTSLRKKKVRDLAAHLELTSVINTRARDLSGGQQQRVALGRSLIIKPKVLLLDEPLSAVDESLRRRLVSLVAINLRESLASTLLVSHSFEDSASLCDWIYFWKGRALSIPKKAEEWVEEPETVDIARAMGYRNIVDSSWLEEVAPNFLLYRKGPTSNHQVVVRKARVNGRRDAGMRPREEEALVSGIVRQTGWRGGYCVVDVEVRQQLLEVVAEEAQEEGEEISVGIDLGSVVAVSDGSS